MASAYGDFNDMSSSDELRSYILNRGYDSSHTNDVLADDSDALICLCGILQDEVLAADMVSTSRSHVAETLGAEDPTHDETGVFENYVSAQPFPGYDRRMDWYVPPSMDAQATWGSAGTYVSDVPLGLPTSSGLAGESLGIQDYDDAIGSEDPMSYQNSSSAAQFGVEADTTYTKEFAFTEGHSCDHMPERFPYDAHRSSEQVSWSALESLDSVLNSRELGEQPPWAHIDFPASQPMALSSASHHAYQWTRSATCSFSDLMASGSGQSSSSNNVCPGSSGAWNDNRDPGLADNMATKGTHIAGSPRRMLSIGPQVAGMITRTSSQPPAIPQPAHINSGGEEVSKLFPGQRRSVKIKHKTDRSLPETLSPPWSNDHNIAQDGSKSPTRTPAGDRSRAATLDVFSCPRDDCSAMFRGRFGKGSLNRHIRLKHSVRADTGVLAYPCEVADCSKSFCRQDARLKHYRGRHTNLNLPAAVPRK